MSIFNQPNFFTIQQLDLENKLILPTTKLYGQVAFQVNALYQDIRSALTDAHSVVATAAKQIYEHPVETMTAMYEQAGHRGGALYAQVHSYALPVYQRWQVNVTTGKEKTSQFLQAFWNNPEQVTLATFEPVTRHVAAIAERTEQNFQMFMDNPEQFVAIAIAPVTAYLGSFTEAAKGVLISSYYVLGDLLGLLMARPLATLQALYHNTLSALLDVYFDVISSFLVIA